jgi:hypothetical protein
VFCWRGGWRRAGGGGAGWWLTVHMARAVGQSVEGGGRVPQEVATGLARVRTWLGSAWCVCGGSSQADDMC